MTIDTNKLRELAQATSGWENCRDAWPHEEHDGIAVVGNIDDDGNKYPVVEIDTGQYYADADAARLAAFYAAANPATVLALLDEVELSRANYPHNEIRAAFKAATSIILSIGKISGAEDQGFVERTELEDRINHLVRIEAAARNLVKVKGRHHAEIAYQKLVEVLDVA